jgi:catechol 2,3-dioxygenase-like lactoylglutathione lyase family enzyme
MARVTGIGGIFFKSDDPASLQRWYSEHLGIESDPQSGVSFEWRDSANPDLKGSTSWALFPRSTTYFDPTKASFMVNYRVDNLDEILSGLRKAGVTVDDRIEEAEYGRFGWAVDPEGNRFELWEPPRS